MTDFESLPRLDELPEQTEPTDLTEPEVDDLLDRAAFLQDKIDAQQKRLDALAAHFAPSLLRPVNAQQASRSSSRRTASPTRRQARRATRPRLRR